MDPNSGLDFGDPDHPVADAELAIAVAAGDRKALAAVFDRYAPRLLAFCHSILHNQADAQACLHDVFILTATRIGGLREPDRLRAWLFAIARHEALRRLDRRKREVLVDEFPDRAPEDSDGPADAAVGSQLAAMLQDAVAGLSDRDRLVLDLADRQGLGTDEVAAALALSPGSAYKLLIRARATARRSIGALLVARTGRRDCADLDALLQNWDGALTPLQRKRVARHIEQCRACQEQGAQGRLTGRVAGHRNRIRDADPDRPPLAHPRRRPAGSCCPRRRLDERLAPRQSRILRRIPVA